MHPLLRDFLEQKLTQENPKAVNRIVARAVENLIRHELWDDAFELIQRFDAPRTFCQADRGGFDECYSRLAHRNVAQLDLAMRSDTAAVCSSSRRNLRSAMADS